MRIEYELHELTEAELMSLQKILLEIYKDLLAVCDKYGLILFLGGGSSLGAVRHGGIIPWDDDIDLMMPRTDYQRLIDLYETELSGKYYLYAPNTQYGAHVGFIKFVKKGTRFVVDRIADTSFYNGITIDIFPMDHAPRNPLLRRARALISDTLRAMALSAFWYQNAKKTGQALGGFKRKLLLFLGWFLSFMDAQKWYDFFDKYSQSYKGGDAYWTIPTGRNRYYKEAHPKEVFFPPRDITFEGVQAKVPNDYNTYLKTLYGDYMQIPPPEKRERHWVLDFSVQMQEEL